jgi:serine protease DegQ
MGINTAIYSRSGGNMGIGFAIPVSTAQHIMRDLLNQGRVTRGWIGVEPQDISPELAASFRLPQAQGQTLQGVVITGVLQNGPAAKAGIRPGDVITQVDQHPVGNVSELLMRVANLPPGKPAQLQVWRSQGLSEVTVTPSQRPAAPRPR